MFISRWFFLFHNKEKSVSLTCQQRNKLMWHSFPSMLQLDSGSSITALVHGFDWAQLQENNATNEVCSMQYEGFDGIQRKVQFFVWQIRDTMQKRNTINAASFACFCVHFMFNKPCSFISAAILPIRHTHCAWLDLCNATREEWKQFWWMSTLKKGLSCQNVCFAKGIETNRHKFLFCNKLASYTILVLFRVRKTSVPNPHIEIHFRRARVFL